MNVTSTSPLWRALQYFSVVAAVALIAILLVRPRLGLFIAWNVLIPLVPIMLLAAPMLWRNLCPIAVVGQFFEQFGLGRQRKRKLSRRLQRIAPTISIALLFFLVPLRLVLFNHDAAALVGLMVATIIISFVGGAIVISKASWCATFCPVLPVERLYGQSPMVNLPHAHCKECSGCTRACFDLIPSRSLAVLSAAQTRSKKPPINIMAIFAIAFPGFIFGYFSAPTDTSIFLIYLWILMSSVVSAGAFTIVQYLFGLRRSTMLRVGAAFAIGIYYWFTLPAISVATVATFNTSPGSEWLINAGRIFLLGIIAVWLARALRNDAAISAVRATSIS